MPGSIPTSRSSLFCDVWCSQPNRQVYHSKVVTLLAPESKKYTLPARAPLSRLLRCLEQLIFWTAIETAAKWCGFEGDTSFRCFL